MEVNPLPVMAVGGIFLIPKLVGKTFWKKGCAIDFVQCVTVTHYQSCNLMVTRGYLGMKVP